MAGLLGLLGFLLSLIVLVVFFKMYARLKDILCVLNQIAILQGRPEEKVGLAFCPNCKMTVKVPDSNRGKCPFCGEGIQS
jgi:hypothetical protein